MSVRSYCAEYYFLSDTHKKKLAALNSIVVVLKSILTYLLAHNFMHAKPLCAHIAKFPKFAYNFLTEKDNFSLIQMVHSF